MSSILQRLYWTAYLAAHWPGQARYPYCSPQRIARDRDRHVRRMVRYAYRCTPYYRETLDRLGLTPADFRTYDDLRQLPLISVVDLQERPEAFRSTALAEDEVMVLRSGGSTGSPHAIWHDAQSLYSNAVTAERERRLHQRVIGRGSRFLTLNIATLNGHAVLARQAMRRGALMPRWLAPRREIVEDMQGLAPVIAQLNALQPDLLAGFGSTLGDLFLQLDASGEPFHRPRLVHYFSDALPGAVRDMLETKYGIAVYSAYQSVEALKLGWECEAHGGYHVNADQYPVRVIDEQGRDQPPGVAGEVVVSNLMNRGMVLLNYRTGDLATLLSEPCPCGRHLPRLSWVEGRTADALLALDGRRVPARLLDRAIRARGGVWQYQAEQQARDRVVVRLRPTPACERDAVAANLVAVVQQELGAGVAVDIVFVDELARTAAGKRRYVINEIERQAHA